MAIKGRFIVFEGGEGSGKDTQISLLKVRFPDAVYTREPGDTQLGIQLRELLLSKKNEGKIEPMTELFLFSAARVQFLKEVVQPALEEGKMVISNRFALSTIAYQVYGREQHELLNFTQEVIKKTIGSNTPDLTILLDIDPEWAEESRIEHRNEERTRFDDEKISFHKRVREGFLKHVKDFGNYKIIDNDPDENGVSMSAEQINRIVLRQIEQIMSN